MNPLVSGESRRSLSRQAETTRTVSDVWAGGRGHLTGRGQSKPPASRRTCRDLVARHGAPDAGTEPVPEKRPAATVDFGALHLRALGPLRLCVSRSALRPVREHVRSRVPARRGRPHALGLPGLHARRGCAALSRLRADRLERAPRTSAGKHAVVRQSPRDGLARRQITRCRTGAPHCRSRPPLPDRPGARRPGRSPGRSRVRAAVRRSRT